MKVFTSMIENEIIKNITFKLKDFYLNTDVNKIQY